MAIAVNEIQGSRRAQMTAAQAAVRVLESEGVDVVFGVPGAMILPFYYALRGSTVEHIVARHEEGATHAADGYARASGKVGVAVATSGPAGTNFVTGIYTAGADSIPLVTITGQVAVNEMHREAFQAVDICEILKPVVKKSFLCKEPSQVPWIFREAFRIAREGRPGPVHIDIPYDVQTALIDYDPTDDKPLPIFPMPPNLDKIRRAVDWLATADRPILIPGGGVIGANATERLVELAEHLDVPVSPTLMAKGCIDEAHPLYMGIVGTRTSQKFANALFLESDTVVAIGARFAIRHTGDIAPYRGDRRFVHVDVDATQIGRIFSPDIGIVSDAGLAIDAMLAEARKRYPEGVRRPEWTAEVTRKREKMVRRTNYDDVPVRAPRVFGELNAFYGPETTFVTAIGLYQIWSGQFQTTSRPRHYLHCGQAAPLGWEISATIGAKLAKPEREFVAVVGDYSFQFLMEEIAVAVQYKIPFVMVMLNNATLGLIRQGEDTTFGRDEERGSVGSIGYGEDGYGIHHVKVVEGMGGSGIRVTDPREIRSALSWARMRSAETSGPVLVEILTDPEENAAMGNSIATVKEYGEIPDYNRLEVPQL